MLTHTPYLYTSIESIKFYINIQEISKISYNVYIQNYFLAFLDAKLQTIIYIWGMFVLRVNIYRKNKSLIKKISLIEQKF